MSRLTALTVPLLVWLTVAVGLVKAEPTAAPKQDARQHHSRPRTDRYGDPLPQGAIARLGTVRLR
ncbi:MAG TPA: hypothetical protein VG013_19120, partial [Gemmataceae bacterium]|nr:hypothetical protein [Gemmataceae bacterium]